MVKPGKLEYIIHVRKTWKTVLQGGVGGGPSKLKYIILVGITWKTVVQGAGKTWETQLYNTDDCLKHIFYGKL